MAALDQQLLVLSASFPFSVCRLDDSVTFGVSNANLLFSVITSVSTPLFRRVVDGFSELLQLECTQNAFIITHALDFYGTVNHINITSEWLMSWRPQIKSDYITCYKSLIKNDLLLRLQAVCEHIMYENLQ